MTTHYLSITEVSKRIGVKDARCYRLPEPDVTVGKARGWAPETIDAWNARRPGRGYRSDLRPGYDWTTGEHKPPTT